MNGNCPPVEAKKEQSSESNDKTQASSTPISPATNNKPVVQTAAEKEKAPSPADPAAPEKQYPPAMPEVAIGLRYKEMK